MPARELVPGDIARVRSGDIVPADLKLLTGTTSVDQSALTGESREADKAPGEVLSSSSIVRRGQRRSHADRGRDLLWAHYVMAPFLRSPPIANF